MKKLLLIGVVVVIAAAAAAYALLILPGREFRAGLDATIQDLAAEKVAVTYKTADYAVMDDKGTLTGVIIRSLEDPVVTVTVDSIEIDAPNDALGKEWRSAQADPATVPADAVVPIADHVTLKGITAKMPASVLGDTPRGAKAPDGDVTYVVESFSLANPRIYPHALVQADLKTFKADLADLEQMSKRGSSPSQDKLLATLTRSLSFYSAVYLGIGYDRWAIDNVTFEGNMAAMDASGPIAIKGGFRRMSGDGLARAVMQPMTVEDYSFQMTPPGHHCTVAKFDSSRWDFSKPAEQILSGKPLAQSMLDSIEYGDMEVLGLDCTIPEAGPIHLDRFALASFEVQGGVPVVGEIAVEGFKISKKMLAATGPDNPLLALGLDQATLSTGTAFTFEANGGVLELTDTRFGIDELGKIAIDAKLTDVPEDPENLPFEAKFVGGSIRYTDASLVERALALAADQEGTTPEAYLEQLTTAVPEQANAMGLPPNLAEAVVTFLKSPSKLTIMLRPPEPVPLETLYQADTIPPPKLVQMLGVNITANQ